MLDLLLLAQQPAGVDHDGRTFNHMTIDSFPTPAAQLDMLMILGLGGLILIGVVLMNLQVLRRTWPAMHWDWVSLLKAKLYFLPVLVAVICLAVGLVRVVRLSPPPTPEVQDALPNGFIGLEHPLQEDLPEWVQLREVQHLAGGGSLFVVSSEMKTSVQEADEQIQEQIKDLIRGRSYERTAVSDHSVSVEAAEGFGSTFSKQPYPIPDELISNQAIKRRVIEVNRIDFGGNLGVQPMYRVHAQVELSPEIQRAVYPYWRQQELSSRATVLGAGLLVGFIVLTAAYIFLRATGPGGESRGWLRLGTVFTASALIFGVSLLLTSGWLLRL